MLKAMSFRLKSEVIQKISKNSQLLKLSKTHFVVEAINLLSEIVQHNDFEEMDINKIKQKVSGRISFDKFNPENIKTPNKVKPRLIKNRSPGFILDLMYQFIKSKNGDFISTPQIAEELSIRKATARPYLRRIVNKYPHEFEIFYGRPNQIRYNLNFKESNSKGIN